MWRSAALHARCCVVVYSSSCCCWKWITRFILLVGTFLSALRIWVSMWTFLLALLVGWLVRYFVRIVWLFYGRCVSYKRDRLSRVRVLAEELPRYRSRVCLDRSLMMGLGENCCVTEVVLHDPSGFGGFLVKIVWFFLQSAYIEMCRNINMKK